MSIAASSDSTSAGRRVAVVTGATSGIGFHVAMALAKQGARVCVSGRDEERGRRARRSLCRAAGHEDVVFVAADASTVAGNRRLAERVLEIADRLDVLVNNVGAAHNDCLQTADGYEASLATNFVGRVALTEALLPLLCGSAPARLIDVTSAAHLSWRGDPFADLGCDGSYSGFKAYARSKLLSTLWTLAVARSLRGTGVAVNSVAPGMAWTSQTRTLRPRFLPAAARVLWPFLRLVQRLTGSPERAARAPIWAATSPEAAGLVGAYIDEKARPRLPMGVAADTALQDRARGLGTRLVEEAAGGR